VKTTKHRLAFIISRVLGPLPLLCLLWLATAVKSGIGIWRALWVYPVIFIIGIAIPFSITTYILIKRHGRTTIEWTNIKDRMIFVPLLFFFWSINLVAVYFLTNRTVFHLSLLAAALTVAAFFITVILKFKISLHIMAASGVFWGVNFMTHFKFWWLFLLLPPLIWARYVLKIHTLTELASAAILANTLILLAVYIFGWPAVP
jgi:hypothetical protein